MNKYITLILSIFILFSCNNLSNNGDIRGNIGTSTQTTGTNSQDDSGINIEDSLVTTQTGIGNGGDDKFAGWNLAESSGKFSLKYPDNFFDKEHEPQFFTGACSTNDLENVRKIAKDLQNFSTGSIKTSTRNINGSDYLAFTTQDAATGHTYTNYYYSTNSNNECFVVLLETSKTNCDFYLPLEDGNVEQKNNYEACISKNENFDKTISDIEGSFELKN